MSWHHVEDTTIRVPRYQTKSVPREGAFGATHFEEHSTKVLTGVVDDVVHRIWRCGSCKRMAVTRMTQDPGKCSCRA